MKILLVEDEKNLGLSLKEFLGHQGHHCELATTCLEAKKIFAGLSPSIVLLDVNLPDGNGLELAKELRLLYKNFVLIFLSAMNDPEIRVQGLELGAHDYITKPFALREVLLKLERIGKLDEKLQQNLQQEICVGPLKIWFSRYEVQDANGNLITLTQKECAILELLYRQRDQVVGRDRLIEEIWGADQYPSNRTVDNYIVKLRKWLESDPNHSMEIKSIRSIGYKLVTKKD